MAAADTDAIKNAIATAGESRRHIKSHVSDSEEHEHNHAGGRENQDQNNEISNNSVPMPVAKKESGHGSKEPGSGGAYDSVANFPLEFYHYYHGSNTDLGTLTEVRRTWDAYIRPGGSTTRKHSSKLWQVKNLQPNFSWKMK